jgi:hypothetical protein
MNGWDEETYDCVALKLQFKSGRIGVAWNLSLLICVHDAYLLGENLNAVKKV